MTNKVYKRIAIIFSSLIVLGLIVSCTFRIEKQVTEPVEPTETNTKQQIANSDSEALQMIFSMSGTNDRIPFPWDNNRLFTNQMFRSLFLSNSTYDAVENDLAESFEISDDGLTYKITLKDGLKWSDGQKITMEDVVFSIETVLITESCNGIYTSAFSKISGYKDYIADNELGLRGLEVEGNVLTITLDYVHPMFIQVLAQFAILPEHILQETDLYKLKDSDYWIDPVVSGAFKVDEIVANEYYKLKLNEEYDGITPKIEEIIVYLTEDYKQYTLDGKVDTYVSNIPAEISFFENIQGMDKNMVDLLFYRYFIVNMQGVDGNENEAMQDVNVRKAILYAIDRKTLLQGIYPNLGLELNSGVPDFFEQSNGVTYDYDPDYARELLAQSDYDMSRPLRLAYYYLDQTSIDFMNAVASYLEEVGFTIELIHMDSGSEFLYQTREYDIALKGLSVFEISEWYGEYISSNTSFPNIFGGNGEFDELFIAFSAETDLEIRKELLLEMQNLEQELFYKIPLFTIGQVIFINEDRIYVPEGINFGNTYYKYDIDFEEWEIK
ncbi:MAG: ABC transporter substrate-binding protein [Clostridia bacterium]